MIIHSIHSTDFLKYKQLDLVDLPKQGVITVSGQNESGKTSIGETLCFALFGRTFTLDQSVPKKLIRWGSSRCSVSVLFSTDDTEDIYRIDRYLDVEGTYGAKLSREDDGALLGKGIESVDHQLERLIGFGYDEFIESFYLAQRELTTPQPHSQTIKVMAGIAPLARIHAELDELIDSDGEALQFSQTDLEEAQQQLTALAIDESWMPELSQSYEQLVTGIDAKQTLLEQIKATSQSYLSAIGNLKKKWSEYRYVRGLAVVLGFFAGLSALLWLLLDRMATSSFVANTSAWLTSTFTAFNLGEAGSILKIALTFGALLLLCLIMMLIQRIRMRPDRELADTFTSTLESVDENQAVTTYPERVSSLVDASVETAVPEAIDTQELISACRKYQADESAVTTGTQELNDHYSSLLNILGSHKLQHDFAIRDEQARLDMAGEIVNAQSGLTEKVATQQRDIQVRQKANELLDSTSLQLSHQFNQSILQLASKALPNFTRDRYKHLKIDDNLDVRVFSNDKGDFLDFDEISSGTQRQVMLSLRLAMSQQLINAIECGEQFLFLDEPFAFFDQQRIRDTIKALPEFSQDIRQIWLVAQEFPEGTETALEIDCQHQDIELTTQS